MLILPASVCFNRKLGPGSYIWLFEFERLSDILESYDTNRKNVEVQVMEKLLVYFAIDVIFSRKYVWIYNKYQRGQAYQWWDRFVTS